MTATASIGLTYSEKYLTNEVSFRNYRTSDIGHRTTLQQEPTITQSFLGLSTASQLLPSHLSKPLNLGLLALLQVLQVSL